MEFLKLSSQFKDLDIHFNQEGWGPQTGDKSWSPFGIPYAHFDKKDKIGRPADFTVQSAAASSSRQHHQRRRDDHYGASDISYKFDATEDATFQLVDSTKSSSKAKHSNAKRQVNRLQQNRNVKGGLRGKAAGDQGQGRKTVAGMRGKMPFRGRKLDRKVDRTPSLSVGGEWKLLEEYDLPQLLKLVVNPPQVEDLLWCGHLDQYDDNYDKITTKSARNLRRSENKTFFSVTSSEDPVLERFAVDGLGNVFATDAILAQLVAAPRSVYSWDIIVQKLNGMIFLDKRDDSNFDLLTVSETAPDPPSASDDVEEFNHPDKLAIEATLVNQNFSQQILMENDLERKKFEANPFLDETQTETESASVAYRYRKFTMGAINLITRCELHGWSTRRNEEEYATIHAINEWDSTYSSGVNWRQTIDKQRGTLVLTEIKNNSAKFAKWTAQAILAGAHQMKLGYVSRVAPNNPYEHVILSMQAFKPRDLAGQTNLSITNMWGIIKMICDVLMSKPDGKYVIMKDPNKAVMRIYSVPLNTFEEEEEDEVEKVEDDAAEVEAVEEDS